MIISFTGHSKLNNQNELKQILFLELSKLLDSTDFIRFYCGGYGDFDNICAEILLKLKSFYQNFESILILPYPPVSKHFVLSGCYDNSIYPPLEKVPKSLAILKRNEWMVNESDLIIAYVSFTFGGAYKTIQYAEKKRKQIRNLAELINYINN